MKIPSSLSVLETVLYATNLDAIKEFYVGVLGLKVQSEDPGRLIFFRCQNQMILFFDPQQSKTQDRSVAGNPIPKHGTIGEGHLAFVVEKGQLEDWAEYLVSQNVEIESRISWGNEAHSIYFRDPAGNSLEFATRELWS